jgi:hypothetical protein
VNGNTRAGFIFDYTYCYFSYKGKVRSIHFISEITRRLLVKFSIRDLHLFDECNIGSNRLNITFVV